MAEKVTIATRLKAVEDGLAGLTKRVLEIEEELGIVKPPEKPPEEKPPEVEKPPEAEKPPEEVRPEEKPAE